MRRSIALAALAALALGGAQASAQSATSTFESATDEGWGTGFGNDASASFAIVNHGPPGNGTNYMRVPLGGFQVAGHEASGADPFLAAMQAAADNEAGYALSYDYYIDTSLITGADPNTSFLQLGTYVNAGNGFYAQHFPGAGKEVELSGTQLASGQIFTGHVDVPMTVFGDMPSAQTFWRPGLIANGGGGAMSGVVIDFDNVSVHPIPEPASIALLGLAVPALATRRRRA
jgi:hypothetical protein